MPNGVAIVNRDDVEWLEDTHAGTFTIRKKWLGNEAGGEQLGCGLYEIPPGQRAFPCHYHLANEEAMYVLAGEGTLRTEAGSEPIEAGDYVVLPVGEDGAHQVINSSDEPLEYLCVSTMRDPDIVVYPDSDKLLCASHAPPGLYKMVRGDAEVGYWHGEGEGATD